VPRTIALVFAHPDDETFATGGTLAKYASEGARMVLYSATDGGAGKSSGIPVSSPGELGRIRRTELAAACQVLGVQPPVIGNHADGQLGAASATDVTRDIVRFLRAERPDVVITFGPEGAPTQHRDHKAISSLTTMACLFAASADSQPEEPGLPVHEVKRLCYVTWPTPAPDELYQTRGQPVHIGVDVTEWLPRKHEAFLAHATQRQHEAAFEKASMLPVECYHVAWGTPAPEGATDIFAGL
jgi:LmbE family N-acetylglucosaminyl deacetylase